MNGEGLYEVWDLQVFSSFFGEFFFSFVGFFISLTMFGYSFIS